MNVTLHAVDGATIPELRQRMAAGRLTAVELTEFYLDRIRRIDPLLGAVLVVNPDAVAEAAASDRRRAAGTELGPLDGIPVLLKDNIDTAGLATTVGSRALLATPPPADAELVARLRAAGAVLLGKANLSEWLNFRSWYGTSGWSAVGGQTRNPYVLDRNPGGSSSGCAVAVAAGLTQVAVGTETDGSLLCPAAINGVVALKPSLGLVPVGGLAVISTEQDTAGPIGRYVVDVALTLAALHGGQPGAGPAAASSPGIGATVSLAGRRVGLWRMAGCDAEVDRVVVEAERTLEAAGCAVVDVELPYQDEIGFAKFPALMAEVQRDLPAYLAGRPGAPQTIAELVEFNRRDPVELSLFGQEAFEEVLDAPTVHHPDYPTWRQTATDLARRSIDETLAAHRLDAIFAPTSNPAWVTDYGAGDRATLASTAPAAVAGYPSVTVPAGTAGPLPVGISFFAGHRADAQVLALAAAFEQAVPARRDPGYLASLDSFADSTSIAATARETTLPR